MQKLSAAGQICKQLEELNIVENTMVIFASDNGSPMRRMNSTTDPDHVTDETLKYYNAINHQSNSILRGIKGDAYEGGHRVLFIVRWPAKIKASRKVDEAICLTDIFKTLVELNGGVLPGGNAEDSYSFLPHLFGQIDELGRPPVIHHSGGKGMFAIRDGIWKMIIGNGSGARTKPVGTPFEEPYQLYYLESDHAESINLIDSEKEVADNLKEAFLDIYGNDLLVEAPVLYGVD